MDSASEYSIKRDVGIKCSPGSTDPKCNEISLPPNGQKGGLLKTETTLGKADVREALFQLNKEIGITHDKAVLADLEKEILKDIEENPELYKRKVDEHKQKSS